MIITVIAETLTSLLIVSTMVYLSQNSVLNFRFCNCLFVFLLKICICYFQESLFAKHLVVLATFPEREAVISFQILDVLIYESAVVDNKILFFYASVKNHNPSVCNIQINYSQEDFKMKKLLLNLLVVMSNDLATVQVRHTLQVLVMI